MSHYRRGCFPGGYYFFTVVTYKRRPLFLDEAARACLRHAWREAQRRRPFELVALCLLPEHLHCVWKLPEGDSDFSKRWAAINAIFAREYLKLHPDRDVRNPSRQRSKEAAVWQRRFWEH
jgi:putative transposase